MIGLILVWIILAPVLYFGFGGPGPWDGPAPREGDK